MGCRFRGHPFVLAWVRHSGRPDHEEERHVRRHRHADRRVRHAQRGRLLPRPRQPRRERLRDAGGQFPPNFLHHPEHDHTDDGQEEVYTVLSGSATLHAGGEEYRLAPGVFARVGPGERRQIATGSEPVQLLAIGGTPGESYAPPPFSEIGVALPG